MVFPRRELKRLPGSRIGGQDLRQREFHLHAANHQNESGVNGKILPLFVVIAAAHLHFPTGSGVPR
jgi:hypothetical protein